MVFNLEPNSGQIMLILVVAIYISNTVLYTFILEGSLDKGEDI